MRAAWYPGDVLLWLVVILPVTAALPLTTLSARTAVIVSPVFVLSVGLLGLLAAWIGTQDGWLGLFVGWHALGLLWTPTVEAFETAELLTLSAVGLVLIRRISSDRAEMARWVLIGAGLLQVAYGLAQWLGRDLLWAGANSVYVVYAVPGTLGNPNYLGMYLGMLAPLAWWPLVPLFAVGLLLTKCAVGIAAATAGLAWQDRPRRFWWLSGGLVMLLAVILWRGPNWPNGLLHRLDVWALALDTLTGWHWLVGYGPGSWITHVPFFQLQQHVWAQSVFIQAHNEWLQVLYETGLIGVALAVGWCWRWRGVLHGAYGGAVVALFVASLGMFGLRLATTGLTAVVVLGLATREVDRAVD